MAQQTDTIECQRTGATLRRLIDADPGDILLLNGGNTRWQLDTKCDGDRLATHAVFYREGSDPTRDDYDWRDDPRLIVEYIRPRFGPERRPTYTVRQVGDGELEAGEVQALRDPSTPEDRWTPAADPEAEAVNRLPVIRDDGASVTLFENAEVVASDGSEALTIARLRASGGVWYAFLRGCDGGERRRVEAVASDLHRDAGRLRHPTPNHTSTK